LKSLSARFRCFGGHPLASEFWEGKTRSVPRTLKVSPPILLDAEALGTLCMVEGLNNPSLSTIEFVLYYANIVFSYVLIQNISRRFLMPTARTNSLNIEYETFGNQNARPLILIMGLGCQMIAWPDAFCEMLSDSGHFVVRFDNRDSGLSTKFVEAGMCDLLRAVSAFENDQPIDAPYLLSDMAIDTIDLMDAIEIEKAHICGFSMGGMIGQTIAIEHPERIKSLITMSSSTMEKDLPEGSPEAMAAMTNPPPLHRQGYVAHMVGVYRAFSSTPEKIDEAMVREIEGRSYDRSFYPIGFTRQFGAILASGGRRERLGNVTTPTLVIHGVSDNLVPMEHAEDLRNAIPGARLEKIQGLGHNLAVPELLDDIVDAISSHTVTAEDISKDF
jgi:pimeloyl-ACP methyl ester carboxylesterase